MRPILSVCTAAVQVKCAIGSVGSRRLPDDLSKVVSVVSQWHVGAVASAVTQLLCQHSSDSVIVLWPLGVQRTQVCNAAYEKKTNNNRKWCAMTGKVSARKLREAQVKSQRCFVWNLAGTSCESWGLSSASSLTWHFTASGNVIMCVPNRRRRSLNTTLKYWSEKFDDVVDWKLRLALIFNHWESLVLCFLMSNSCFHLVKCKAIILLNFLW